LKVAIDFSGGSNYSLLSEQNLTYMPQPPTEQVSTAIETNAEAIINEIIRATTAEGVNATAISALQTEQITQNTVIAANTATIGEIKQTIALSMPSGWVKLDGAAISSLTST